MADDPEGGTAPAAPPLSAFYDPLRFVPVGVAAAAAVADFRIQVLQPYLADVVVTANPVPAECAAPVARKVAEGWDLSAPLTSGTIDQVCRRYKKGDRIYLMCADGTRLMFKRNVAGGCPGFDVAAKREEAASLDHPCITCEGFCVDEDSDEGCRVGRTSDAVFRSIVLAVWAGSLAWQLSSYRVVCSDDPIRNHTPVGVLDGSSCVVADHVRLATPVETDDVPF